jgi:alkaline phosphatase
MRQANCLTPLVSALALGLLISTPTLAAPTIRITPPSGSRFVIDQRFDIRVEYTASAGSRLNSISLSIDGVAQPVSLASLDAFGGIGLRNRTFRPAGPHVIRATASDGVGSSEASAQIGVVGFFPSDPNLSIDAQSPVQPVRNVIILLGDGMGASHRTAARIVRYGVSGGYAQGLLAMDRMPGLGLVMTASGNSIVTDSSPGMSNYVTGNKAYNNQEGVFPDNTPDAFDNPRIEYLSEFLHRKRGKVLGIVTTADVEDATPAANAVHTSDRNAGTGICDQYLDDSARTGLTVLMGGGRRWFLPSGQFGSSRSAATDYVLPPDLVSAYGLAPGAIDPGRNLLADFQAAGFQYVSTRTELQAATGATRLLGLFGYGNMNTALDKIAGRRGNAAVVNDYHAPDQPMLDEMTDAALTVLNKNRAGFVLMVEGAHIDKQSHLMDAERAIWETIEFDRAVATALDFARRDGNTLVIVTADHECSGFSVVGASTKTVADLEALPSDTSLVGPTDHPARQAAVGTYDLAGFPAYAIAPDGYPQTGNPALKPLQVGFGANADRYEDWVSKPLPVIDSLLPDDIRGELTTAGYPAQPIERSPESALGFFIRGQVPGSQAVHTATDVPLSSLSSGSNAWQDFVGVFDNTDVFFKILRRSLQPSDLK